MDDGIRDTICAISTPIGEGGIGIIRISGPMAVKVADPVFKIKSGLKLFDLPTHTIHYGEIIDPDSKEVIDEALLTIMRAPRTYTREDIVEINCHGGPLPIKRTPKLFKPCRLGEHGRCAIVFSDTEQSFRCSCDCHIPWEEETSLWTTTSGTDGRP